MTNEQLYLVIGLPVLFNALLITLVAYMHVKFDAINHRFDDINQRFEDMPIAWKK